MNKVCVLEGNDIASCSGDGTVRSWNMITGEMKDCLDLNSLFLQKENSDKKGTVVVMDLAYDEATRMLFALVEG